MQLLALVMCWSPWLWHQTQSLFLNFAKSRRMSNVGFWFQRCKPRHLTWYSNAGVCQRKSITSSLILQGGYFRTVRFYGAEFFVTDRRLVATLRTKKILRWNPLRYHLEKLRHQAGAQYSVVCRNVSNWFEVLGILKDPEKLWGTFKHETFKAADANFISTAKVPEIWAIWIHAW